MPVCGKHCSKPAIIYGGCVGCELESLRARVAELEAGIRDALSRDMPNTSRSKLLAALNP